MTIDDKIYSIKTNVSMQAVANYYGLSKICPFHDDKEKRFSFNDTRFMCHSTKCGAHGDVIDFVMLYEGMSFIAAMERLNGIFGVYDDDKPLSQFDAAMINFRKAEKFLKKCKAVPAVSCVWVELQPKRTDEHEQAKEQVRLAEIKYSTARAQLLHYLKPVHALHHYLRSQGVYVNVLALNVRIYTIGDTLLNWGYIKIEDCKKIIKQVGKLKQY